MAVGNAVNYGQFAVNVRRATAEDRASSSFEGVPLGDNTPYI